jgi:hypothetical protein
MRCGAKRSTPIGRPGLLCRACFINGYDVSFAIPQGLKPLVIRALFGMTEQAAEKGLIQSCTNEKQIAGAEAHHLFCCVCGTAEAVP